MWHLIETCWDHQPNVRPHASKVVQYLLPKVTQPRAAHTWDKSFVSRLRTNLLEHPFIPHPNSWNDMVQPLSSQTLQKTYDNLPSDGDSVMSSSHDNDNLIQTLKCQQKLPFTGTNNNDDPGTLDGFLYLGMRPVPEQTQVQLLQSQMVSVLGFPQCPNLS
jgi:hypothetical protein